MPSSQSIVQLLFQLQKAIHEKVRDTGNSPALSMSEMMVIKHMICKKGWTVSSIAKMMSVRKPSASHLVKQMEEKGFLERRKNPKDQRSHLLELTQKSIQAIKEVEAFFGGHAAELLDVLSQEEKGKLESLLRKVVESR